MTSTRVLLLSSDDEPLTEAFESLDGAGFDVVRCHDAGAPSFPCIGLDGGTCPFELPGGVDVVLDVRQHAWPSPTLRETGVTCALRAQVPVVIVSDAGAHPFSGHATTVGADADLVEACEDAMVDSLEELRAAVAEAADAVLAGRGIVDAPLSVHVVRRQGRIDVRIAVDAPSSVRGMVATRAAVAVRRFDRNASSLAIEVVEPVFA